MCGFLLDLNVSRNTYFDFNRAFEKIKYRGPDNESIRKFESDECTTTLGHHRLSIIGLSDKNNQPFTSSCGRYHILFNGEIFNYVFLKEKYLGELDFITNSDTEVLINLYIKLGSKMLVLLDGFFSFIIYDSETHHIFGARDYLGVKPLYLEQKSDYFRAGSELKCMRSGKIKQEDINLVALSNYFQFGHVLAPDTILSGVQKLNPGCYFSFDLAGRRLLINQYWDLSSVKGTQRFQFQNLEDAVRSRFVSDVPIATFLSSGVDSAFVASVSPRHLVQDTFTASINDRMLDEATGASATAKSLGLQHNVVKTDDISYDDIEELFSDFDEPFADSSSILVDKLSTRVASNGYKVVISSDGGDELFYGYSRHRIYFLLKTFSSLTFVLRLMLYLVDKKAFIKRLTSAFLPMLDLKLRKVRNLLKTEKLDYTCFLKLFDTDEIGKLLRDPKLIEQSRNFLRANYAAGIDEDNPWKNVKLYDYRIYVPQILYKLDRCGMRNSIEIREPLLHTSLISNTSCVEMSWRDFFRPKHLFRSHLKTLYNIKPTRVKKGFSISQQELIDKVLSEKQHSLSGYSTGMNYLNPEYVDDILQQYNLNKSNSELLWLIIVWLIWAEGNCK